MTWEQFFAQVKDGRIQSVYLFSGPEEHIKQSALRALEEKLLPAGLEQLNETILEGASAQSILEACETLPMLCDRRLVLVRDWALLLPGKARAQKEEEERILAWLDNAPDSCCLVFVVRDQLDMTKKLAIRLSKSGAQVSFDLLDEGKLAKWIRTRVGQGGAEIMPDAIDQLIFLAGRQLTRLMGEADKLAAYAGQGGTVTREAVDLLVPASLEATVFQMIDRLMEGKTGIAFALVGDMLQSGESRIGILAMLTRQMRLMTHMKLLKAEGMDSSQIEKRLALNHYAAQRMQRLLPRFSAAALETAYKQCVDADYAIKSGGARDEAALDQLILALDQMIRAGK